MKRKIISFLLISIIIFGITGCGKDSENNKEVSFKSFIIDYDNQNNLGNSDKAKMIVIANIKPEKEILLDDISMSLNIDSDIIDGEKYEYANLVLYDTAESLKVGESAKVAYVFEMEKYLYKENDNFKITYQIGTQKSEYSYVIENTSTIKKKNIIQVNFLEDIIKETYENSNDALMISALKWKINDIKDAYDTYHKYSSSYGSVTSQLMFSANYGCESNNSVEKGQRILNFVSENETNEISISNYKSYIYSYNLDYDEEYIKYNLPTLDYDVLEKYYPGIKEKMENLNTTINTYANGMINVEKDKCYRETSLEDVWADASSVNNLIN